MEESRFLMNLIKGFDRVHQQCFYENYEIIILSTLCVIVIFLQIRQRNIVNEFYNRLLRFHVPTTKTAETR